MTPQSDRIASLDVLRGLGILGILAVNAAFFAMPLATTLDPQVLAPMDEASTTAWAAVRIFFERKFVTLFSMLFGASILLVGGEDRTQPERSGHLTRRLGWLFLFGLIHGALIWYGDILLVYAVAGFIAAQLRAWKAGRLIAVGLGAYLVFALFEFANYWIMAAMPDAVAQSMTMFGPEGAREEIAGFRGSLLDVQAANFRNWALMVGNALIVVPGTCGLMLTGMGLFKSGFFAGRRPALLYMAFAVLGALALAALAWATQREIDGAFKDGYAFALHMTLNSLFAPVVTLGYIGIVCLVLRTPLRALTAPLAATGQMAFTNYIAQSLIMTGVFWSVRGLGLFGTFSYAELAAVVGGVWLLQLIWSPIWLRFFRYGPLEWVWRRLTYARPVAFMR